MAEDEVLGELCFGFEVRMWKGKNEVEGQGKEE